MHNQDSQLKISDKKFLIPTPEDLKALRKKKKYTQSYLAELTGLSQSLIARIENGSVNLTVSTLKLILSFLDTESKNHQNKTASDIAQNKLITISNKDSIRNSIEVMNKYGISQIPISDATGEICGSISEKKITSYLSQKGKEGLEHDVSAILENSFPIISNTTSLQDVERLLIRNSALIVKNNKDELNIITKSDLLNYFQNLI